MTATPPPSKKEQVHKLLERGSVFVYLDPRRDGVVVPPWHGKKPQLVLQIGLNFPIPIHDLEIDDEGIRCTLSFNRAPFYCVLPWSAVYALVAEDGQVTVWPSEIPSELVPYPEPARRDAPRDRREKDAVKRPRISVVPPPPAEPVPAAAKLAPALAADVSDTAERPSRPEIPPPPGPAEERGPESKPPGAKRPKERPSYLRVVK